MSEDKTRVGRYEIIRKIGEGGFGIVYEARDTTLDRSVALKQLRLELAASPEYLERFRQESRSMGSLNHPNIIHMMDVFEDNGRYFLVMNYMPNGSLADKLKEGKPLSLAKTVEILKPIAKALDYAHSKNLIHRDVKPSNILFTETDEPMLSDFGLVKSLETGGLTSTGATFGTPEYMAPEQILGKDLTAAVDIYALGIVAYQMLTGKIPFEGKTPFEIQEGHVHIDPPDIKTINPALPSSLSKIFVMVLKKSPNLRSNTAQDFIIRLENEMNIQVSTKHKETFSIARNAMEKLEFETARNILIESDSIESNSEIHDLFQENDRRENIYREFQRSVQRISDEKQTAESIISSNPWLSGYKDAQRVLSLGTPSHNLIAEKFKDIFLICAYLCAALGAFPVFFETLTVQFVYSWSGVNRNDFTLWSNLFDYLSFYEIREITNDLRIIFAILGIAFIILTTVCSFIQSKKQKINYSGLILITFGLILSLGGWVVSFFVWEIFEPIIFWLLPFFIISGLLLIDKSIQKESTWG